MLHKALFVFAIAIAVIAPAAAQFWGGAVGGEKTFVACLGTPCFVAQDVTNHWIATKTGKLQKCWIEAKREPIGAPLRVDILRDGASVFVSPLTLAAGSKGPVWTKAFSSPQLSEGNILRLDILQVGTVQAGQDVTVTCQVQ
jgi:hypothetical protein